MNLNKHIPEEISTLASHYFGVLERKFPNRMFALHAGGWISIEIDGGAIWTVMCFLPSSAQISITPFKGERILDLDYADPRFTETTVCDILADTLEGSS